jgi:hypothetical protein
VAAAALAVGGCGDRRTPVPSLFQPVAPDGFYPRADDGVQLEAPRDWSLLRDQGPLVLTISSGEAVIALWRYPAGSGTPLRDGLGGARDALIAAARRRDPGLELIRSSLLTIDGDGAVELDAIEQIDGQIRRVRSMHVYAPGGEVVLEEYAPPGLFHAVDHSVFSPVRRSLRVQSPGAA